MHPFTVETQIARPREEVFEYLADVANHPEFTDHFLKEWRMTREDTYGLGAGGRFHADLPFTRFAVGRLDDRRRRAARRRSCCRAAPASSTASAR